MTLPTLPERIARLVADLRAAAVDIEFSSLQFCRNGSAHGALR